MCNVNKHYDFNQTLKMNQILGLNNSFEVDVPLNK